MLQRVIQSWFLIALVGVLTVGAAFGHSGPERGIELFLRTIRPPQTTAIVLFLMAFSLDSQKRREALFRPGAAVWGCIVNFGVLPLLAWPLALSQRELDFQHGLAITAFVPCTLATASVFTRKAGGNDAVSLLVTLVTNLGCVVLTPFWLQLWFGRSATFNVAATVEQLTFCVLIPTVLGQLAQLPPGLHDFSARHRRRIGMLAQGIVLLLVCVAATQAGRVLKQQPVWPSVLGGAWMLASCLLLHGATVAFGWWTSGWFRLSRADAIAVAISGSQKTLPVGLMIAANPSLLTEPAPFVTFPLLVYHAGQLVMDGVLAERWSAGEEGSRGARE